MSQYEIDGKFLIVSDEGAKKVLSPGEYKFYKSGRVIPMYSDVSLWKLKSLIDDKLIDALKKNQISPITQENKYSKNVYGIGDYINGPASSVQSMATGKVHDSKSELRREYKRHGLIEMGSDAKAMERKEIRGDYDCRRDVAQAIEQTGLMDRLKKGERLFQ